ncbi:helix-turn-helix domain-containing protein [Methylopila henanensis]|uniref:Helix-turn-helix domain-containing protein n=1 Tax=Methylopila henanensis TaxID=873516 RepID=A0ABW4KAA8_9HYPH
MSYFVPQTLEHIVEMRDRGDSENATLEFKSSRLLDQKNDRIFEALSREITALANSIGGVLIIGVEEDSDRRIAMIAPIGDAKKNEAWIEDGLLSRITPSLNFAITRIEASGGHLLVIDVPPSLNAPHQSADKRYYARRLFRVDPLLAFEIDDIRRRVAAIASGASLSVLFQGGEISFVISNEGIGAVFNVWIQIDGIENSTIAKIWSPGLGRPYTEPFRIVHPGERRTFLGASFDFFQEKLGDRMHLTLHYADFDENVHRKYYTYYLKDFDSTITLRSTTEKLLDSGVKNIEKLERRISELARDIHEIRERAFHPSGLNLSKTTLSVLAGKKDIKWPGESLSFQALAEVLDVDSETAIKIQEKLFGAHHYVGGRNVSLNEIDLADEVKNKIRQLLKFPPEEQETQR